jgi:hypothetical protein
VLSYGLDRQKLRRSGQARYAVRFGLRLIVEESGEEAELLRETVSLPGRVWRGDPWGKPLGATSRRD